MGLRVRGEAVGNVGVVGVPGVQIEAENHGTDSSYDHSRWADWP